MTMALMPLATEDVLTLRRICIDEWQRIMLNADWDAMASLLTDDVVFLPPDQPIVEGKHAVRAWMDSFPVVMAFKDSVEHTDGRGDFAWTRGRFEMTVEPSPGVPVVLKGKWTATFRKQPDGTWLTASDMWNSDHPAA